jgi:hypothetical protein
MTSVPDTKEEWDNGDADVHSRSHSIEKREETSTSDKTAAGNEKVASEYLSATREIGTDATSVTAGVEEKKDDDDFPDGGLRAWLVVLGVSVHIIPTTVLVLIYVSKGGLHNHVKVCCRKSALAFTFTLH